MVANFDVHETVLEADGSLPASIVGVMKTKQRLPGSTAQPPVTKVCPFPTTVFNFAVKFVAAWLSDEAAMSDEDARG